MTFNAHLFREDGFWLAQCLEYDLVAQATTASGALRQLQRSVAARVCIAAELGIEPFAGLPAAPAERL